MEEATYIKAVRDSIDSESMPRQYHQHIVYRRARASAPGALVLPLSWYADAVPYSQTDSVLVFWVECLATSRRWLCAVLRKRAICKCGCKGWCSYHPLFSMLAWSFRAAAAGEWPGSRHDQGPWRFGDEDRRVRVGAPMAHRCAIVFVKGDWCEYACTFGLPSWNDSIKPCFGCAASGADMYSAHGNSVNGLRWICTTHEGYAIACARCERRVHLPDVATRDLVVRALRYDKRSGGSNGRALAVDIPHLDLLAGDRLEPSESLRDVSLLDDVQTPIDILFWRCAEDTATRHRNPVFDLDTGVTLDCLTVDLLHALNLGVMLKFCAVVLWCLIDSDVFPKAGTSEENVQNAVLLLRAQLMAWYRQQQRERPERSLTRVSDLTVKMIGSRHDPKCKTKGAETFGLLLFLNSQLATHRLILGRTGQRLLRAGTCLVELVDKWASCWRVLSPADIQAHAKPFRHLGPLRCKPCKTCKPDLWRAHPP